jgi:ubiquinone/menaquinone biosynthesis C-methylase UbiE
MFTKSAEFYDVIYSWKNYDAEAELCRGYVQQYKRSAGATLLDVACGTGMHLQHLRQWYTVEGLDLDPELLKIARGRCPDVPLHEGNMIDFDLDKQFDIVTCLFSSVGYTKTVDKLNQTIQNFARHLLPGGVMLIEPWLMPGQFIPRTIGARFVDLPELKIARLNHSKLVDGVSILQFEYLIGTPDGVEHLSEQHELGLFSDEDYRAALRGAGLETTFETPGLDGRGIYIGVKPA